MYNIKLPSHDLQGFEPGTYQLYSCAIDTSGARTCATASIEVLQPPPATAEQKAAMVDGTLGKIDVEQLASTGVTCHLGLLEPVRLGRMTCYQGPCLASIA